jgi:hypothetical protein
MIVDHARIATFSMENACLAEKLRMNIAVNFVEASIFGKESACPVAN